MEERGVVIDQGLVTLIVCGIVAALVAGCGKSSAQDEGLPASRPSTSGASSPSSSSSPPVTKVTGRPPEVSLPTGQPPHDLVVKDLKPGTGAAARPGDELTTQFVAVFVTGKKLESSWGAGRQPFSFKLGANESSPGWERGLRGMREGGRRELIVPPHLSSRFGTPPNSGPEDTLVYVIDLLDVQPGPKARRTTRSEPKVSAPERPAPDRLVVRDLIDGSGPTVRRGDEITVEYVGIHYDGKHFTNSWKRAKPFEFRLGGDSAFVNPGWERGIPGMRVGGRRELIVPPALLYRSGPPPESKPTDALVYVIDLISIAPR